jgi:protein-disulfide isomerase
MLPKGDRQTGRLAYAITAIGSIVLPLCAAIITAAVVYRYVLADSPQSPEPEIVRGWEDILPRSQLLAGSTIAPVDVVVLVDYQCPACRAFHGAVMDLVERRPQDVKVWYVDHPLDYHEHAAEAALAAECAAQAGAFRPMVDVMFAKQESLAVKPWTGYAVEAGVADTSDFAICVDRGPGSRRVEEGLRFGAQIGLSGTPTVLIEGWLFPAPPTRRSLNLAIDAILDGKRPKR